MINTLRLAYKRLAEDKALLAKSTRASDHLRLIDGILHDAEFILFTAEEELRSGCNAIEVMQMVNEAEIAIKSCSYKLESLKR